ncbi:MAG: sugar ABC transporter permease [Provencibacterium sp.]|nr:sugar ABC transporter permease [Provencibacterium sp.]
MKKRRPQSLDNYTFLFFTLPAVILYTYFYIYSLITGIGYSFTNWNGIDPTYEFNGLRNYALLMQNPRFWNSLRVTLVYGVMLLFSVIIMSLLLALCLDSLKRFKTFTKSIFFFPAMISAVAISLIWDQLFYRAVPVIGETLGIAALSQSPLANPKLALVGVVFVNAWQAVAMPTLIFLAGLQSIPAEMHESAMIDGASPFERFRHITFPYLLPTVTVNMVLTIKQGITTFDFPFALSAGTGGPARSTEVIGIMIYNDAFQSMKFSMANAEAVILFIIIAFFSFIQIKVSSKGGVN